MRLAVLVALLALGQSIEFRPAPLPTGPTSASTIVLGAPAGTTQSATVTLRNAAGPLAGRRLVRLYWPTPRTGHRPRRQSVPALSP